MKVIWQSRSQSALKLCIDFSETCLCLLCMVEFENDLGIIDYQDKMMCCEQEPCHWAKGQGHSPRLNFVHRYQ